LINKFLYGTMVRRGQANGRSVSAPVIILSGIIGCKGSDSLPITQHFDITIFAMRCEATTL
jgi:hypothetical protein